MNLTDILERVQQPEPWSAGEKIPWNEPGFSKRMLKEHLSQDHDMASRRASIIDRQVEWIFQSILGGQAGRVLDLGCGPGLYTSRLARRGCDCRGIDFSPASIAYARAQAEGEGLKCDYVQGDMRQIDFGSGYDLAMLLFGELNVFIRADAHLILKKAHQSLTSGGRLLLEPHTFDAVKRIGGTPSSWYSAGAGLFSEKPHLCLTEAFWDEASATATQRYWIVETESEQVTPYGSTMQAYSKEAYRNLLGEAGFKEIEFQPALTGDKKQAGEYLMVISARK